MKTSIIGSLAVVFVLSLNGVSQAQTVGSTYKVVAFTGQSAPGGKTYQTFGNPRIGADGSIGFIGSSSRDEGFSSQVFAGRPENIRMVASTGDRAPGFSLESFGSFQDISVSKSGLVSINAEVTNDGAIPGIWTETSSGLALVGYVGATDANENQINALGVAAFRSGAVVAKGQSYASEEQTHDVLFSGGKPLSEVLQSGQYIAGKQVRTIYDTSSDQNSAGTGVDANESGQVIFKAVASPSASPAPRETIYTGRPSAFQPVATQNDAAPGIANAYYVHPSARPSVAANGLIGFSSTLSSSSGADSAIFSGVAGAIVPVAIQGAIVPTTSDVRFGSLSDAVVNSQGDVIFRATIEYANETSRTGIWLRRKTDSEAVLIAVSGIDLPTPSGMQKVTDVDFAGPGTFNDLHEFVFRAVFDNEDEGIYIADTRPLPPTIRIKSPSKPRERVTTRSNILVSGTAVDDTGVAKVEYTVARELSALRKGAHKRGKRLVVSRTKLARGASKWSFKIPLSMGLNLISITATDKLGNVSPAYKLRILRYKPEK